MLWFFFIEFEEKGFDCNPRLGFVLVLIRGSDEGRLSFPRSIGLRLVIPELPDIGSLRPLLERDTSKLISCAIHQGFHSSTSRHKWLFSEYVTCVVES